jgi:hypothetical protein
MRAWERRRSLVFAPTDGVHILWVRSREVASRLRGMNASSCLVVVSTSRHAARSTTPDLISALKSSVQPSIFCHDITYQYRQKDTSTVQHQYGFPPSGDRHTYMHSTSQYYFYYLTVDHTNYKDISIDIQKRITWTFIWPTLLLYFTSVNWQLLLS